MTLTMTTPAAHSGPNSFAQTLIAIRRDIHRNPELGFREFRTADLIARHLDALQLTPVCGLGGTGLYADIHGERPGSTVLLRADMDALPIQEARAGGYCSINPGVMHACGHDAHTAALLGAAMLLTRPSTKFAGRIRLMFQPAEELLLGAAAMIKDGVLEGVDRALSGHVFAGLPVGTVALRAGEMMAGADLFTIRIGGRATHAGAPHTGVNPILAATQLMAALPALASQSSPPGEHLMLGVTSIKAGSAPNVIPEELEMCGNLRWYSESLRRRLLDGIAQLGELTCRAFGASFSLQLNASVPVTMNAHGLLPAIAQTLDVAGASCVDIGRRGASEDFALIAQAVPSFYVGIGAGGPSAAPHHCGAFDIDESVIAWMAELFANSALKLLS